MNISGKIAIVCFTAVTLFTTWIPGALAGDDFSKYPTADFPYLAEQFYRTDLEIQLGHSAHALIDARTIISVAWKRKESPVRVALLLDKLGAMFAEPCDYPRNMGIVSGICRGFTNYEPDVEYHSISQYCLAKATAIRLAKSMRPYDGMPAIMVRHDEKVPSEPEPAISLRTIFIEGKPAPAEAYLRRSERAAEKNTGYVAVVSLLESARAELLRSHAGPEKLNASLIRCGEIAEQLQSGLDIDLRPLRLARLYYEQAYESSLLTGNKTRQTGSLQELLRMQQSLSSSTVAAVRVLAMLNTFLELQLQTRAVSRELIPTLTSIADQHYGIGYALSPRSMQQNWHYDTAERLWNQALTIAESEKCDDYSASRMLAALASAKHDLPAFEKYWKKRKSYTSRRNYTDDAAESEYKQAKAQLMAVVAK